MQNVIVYWHKPKSTGPATLWIVNYSGQLLSNTHADDLPTGGQTLRLIEHGCVLTVEVTCRDYGEYLAWKARRDAEKVRAFRDTLQEAIDNEAIDRLYHGTGTSDHAVDIMSHWKKSNTEHQIDAARYAFGERCRCTAVPVAGWVKDLEAENIRL
jgi:hypothetical protein